MQPMLKTSIKKSERKITSTSCPLALIIAVGGLLASSTALRAEETNNISYDQKMECHHESLYQCHELSVDAFGTASLGQHTIEHLSGSRIRHNTELGAGVGLNYFFCRQLGIAADAYSENTSGPFIDSASINLIFRLPLGNSGFAPYLFGGGGYQFDLDHASFGQAGAGMEYRFNRQMGMFIDARGVLPEKTRGYGLARLGVRFIF